MTLDLPTTLALIAAAALALVVIWRVVPAQHRDKALAAATVAVAVLGALLAGGRRSELDDGPPPEPTEPDLTPSPGMRVLREHVGGRAREEVEAVEAAAADGDLDTLADLANARDARARGRQ